MGEREASCLFEFSETRIQPVASLVKDDRGSWEQARQRWNIAVLLEKGAIEMGALLGESGHGAAGYAPLVVRVLVNVVMAAREAEASRGPANFGQALAGLGVLLRLNVGHSTKHRTYDC